MTCIAQRKHHIVYRTTCTVTGKFYVGMHSTDDLDDGYMGSGRQLRRSLRKYGINNHMRTIVEECTNRITLIEREIHTVNIALQDPLCMNIALGGLGGSTRHGAKHAEHTKERIRQSLMGHTLSAETRAKIGAKSKGRGKGVPLSEEHKAKLRTPSEAKRLSQIRRWANARIQQKGATP